MTTLKAIFSRGYEGPYTVTITRDSLLECLKVLVDNVHTYLSVDDIEDDGMSADEVIQRLESENGDGCDYIEFLADVTPNRAPVVLIDAMQYISPEVW